MTAKETFDKNYEQYRNLHGKKAIPLEARQLVFDTMEEYAQTKINSLDLSSVRLSCMKEVWDKWHDLPEDDEFSKWLYEQGHEA